MGKNNNNASCWQYIKSDLCRYTDSSSFNTLLRQFLLNRSFKYSFWLRLAKHPNLPLRLFARLMHRRLSGRYLIQIPVTTQIGFGLYLGHHMCIVVNETAILGNNVNLSQFTTIGAIEGRAAEIGDNVYIGPGVCVVENVKIGNNATVGAGSVVTRDVPENATVAGVPAAILHFDRPGRYVNQRWPV